MIDGTPENDHLWKPIGDPGTVFFVEIHILRRVLKPRTAKKKKKRKSFVLRNCKSDISTLSTKSIIMVQ